jgi:UDP-glucuronate 4-epimerase
MKHIFITGIAGFIGYHLALALKKRGDHVIGCDHFNAYYNPALKRERSRLLRAQGIEVYTCDIADWALLTEILQRENISDFVHLAAQAGVRFAITHPESYVHSNLHGFTKVLELVRGFEGMSLVYASSSSVYGLNGKVPFSESDTTDHPASFYGATKKANEMMAHAYHHLYGFACTGLRFFTVYGPWGRPDMAYYSFAQAIDQGRLITVYGDGSMQRDFTYIDDIVQGIIAAIDKRFPFEIFNLGNNAPKSVLELISVLEKLLGKKALLRFEPASRVEVATTFADITKSTKHLGYEPTTTLEEGLERFINWYLPIGKAIDREGGK